MVLKSRTTGIFVNLYRSPLRVVFRRQKGIRWDQLDIYKPSDKIDAVVTVIDVLAKGDLLFPEKFLDVDAKHYHSSSHRTRYYIHKEREKLYDPDRNDLVKKHSRQVAGIWLGTNLNTQGMLQVIREACEAAKIDFGVMSSFKW